jgi:hypothetical protein
MPGELGQMPVRRPFFFQVNGGRSWASLSFKSNWDKVQKTVNGYI